MSGQPDTSDDLIAELAKLMATNAKGDASAAPARSPATPAGSPATPESKPSLRIPGMDMPPLTVVPLDGPRTEPRPSLYSPRPLETRPAEPVARSPEKPLDKPVDKPVELRAVEPRPTESRPSEPRAPEVRVPQYRPVEVKPTAAATPEPRPSEVAASAPRSPEPRPTSAAPTIRIPGMDQPPLVPETEAEPQPSPVPRFNLSQPSAPAPTRPVEVAANQPPAESKPAPAPERAAASETPPPVAPHADAPSLRPEPRAIGQGSRPAEPRPAAPDARRLDFGLAGESARRDGDRRDQPPREPPVSVPVEEQKPVSAGPAPSLPPDSDEDEDDDAPVLHRVEPRITPAPSGSPLDPIADIIAASLKEDAPPPARPVAKPVVVPVAAPRITPTPPRPAPLGSAPPGSRLAPASPGNAKPPGFSRHVPPETDTFFVAPALGLGGKPNTPVAAPTASNDPMDEIETLIGEAVRVDMDNGRPAAVQHQPLPRPPAPAVATQPAPAPRRAAIQPQDATPPSQSAEAAILAAAAATGAEVGRIEPVVDDEPVARSGRFAAMRGMRTSGMRQYVGLAVAGTLLLASGFGLYWVLGMGRGDPATAPLLTADATPVKQPPAAAVADAEPRSPVFDQIEGVTTPESEEALVSRDQTAGEPVNTVVATTEENESGLASRKVRTVTVRPDGTIVSSDDAVAGAEALPVERPNVPAVPGEAASPSDLLTATATATDDPIGAMLSGGDPASPAPLAPLALDLPVTPGSTDVALAPGATPTPSDVVAPTPLPRPSDRTALAGAPSNAVTAALDPTLPSLDPTPEPEPAAQQAAIATTTSSGGSGAAYVQLSSQRSEAEARTAAQNVLNRWGNIVAGRQLEIHRADLGARGIYYRVWLPAGSRAEAVSLCQQIQASGGSDACYVP